METIFNQNKCLFISEVSSNHNGDINRCKELIDATAEAGCDGVKFQLFKIKDLFSPEAIRANPKLIDRIQWELKEEMIPELADYSKTKNLLFSCTPFYLDAVDVLEPFVDFFKIASYELLWKDLFVACANTGKPLVFSTGMCIEDEIHRALDSIENSKVKEVLILHCNSSYPTPIQHVNLAVIDTLRNKFSTQIPDKLIDFGWSDHTVSPSVMLSAVLKYKSKMVEFHIDLDGRGREFESGHCWLPNQIGDVINLIREASEADGSALIQPSPSELIERQWRADPHDGLRPLKETREKLIKGEPI